MTAEAFVRFASPVADHQGLASLGLGYGCAFESAGVRGRRRVRPNTLLWLFPGVFHRYYPDPWWAEQWVLFTGSLPAQYEQAGLFSPKTPVVELADVSSVSAAFDEIGAVFRDHSNLTAVYAGAVLPRLITATHECARSPRGDDGTTRSGSSKAVRHLAQSALEQVDLADVARSCGMSPATFRRHIRLETGSSPVHFVMRVRIDAAKHLLATTDLPVQRVGAAVGYPSPAYFTRVFTSHEGIGPTAFRTQQRRS